MTDTLLQNESLLRLSFFFTIMLIMMLWEVLSPRREQLYKRSLRWTNNLALTVLNTMVLRLVFPLAAVGAAIYAAEHQVGLFHWLNTPTWLSVVASIVLLDLIIYFQHRLFHAVPWLWRLHRMHHADLEFDVTTGLRFHPFEILLSMGIKIALVIALGAPAEAVILFEIILNGASLFNHGNVRLPESADRVLRLFIVTPDMHRVHHSTVKKETNSNFGFSVSWWDRLFGTYREDAEAGQLGFTIGVEEFRTAKDLHLDRMLIQPLRRS